MLPYGTAVIKSGSLLFSCTEEVHDYHLLDEKTKTVNCLII